MLRELCSLAEREHLIGDVAFEVKPIAWIIELTASGELIGNFTKTRFPVPNSGSGKGAKKGKPKEEPKKYVVPKQFNPETGGTRTAGDYAYFLVDKSDYVLGCALGEEAKRPPTDPKLIKRLLLFTDKVDACYEATKEPQLVAVLTFLKQSRTTGLPVAMPVEAVAGDLFGFIVRPEYDEFVHDLPAVRDYWRSICASRPTGSSEDWHCLITGRSMGKSALFPQIKRVPGAQAQSGLISFNSPAFESYGWKSNDNAPVSSEAAQAASIAMNRLLDPAFQRQDGEVLQRRNIRLSPDTVVCYWAASDAGEEIASKLQAMLQVDPGGKAGQLWQSVWRGKRPEELDESRFYALTLSGAQGRTIVRDWYEAKVGEVQISVADYFNQLELAPNTFPAKGKSLPPHYALRILQESLTSTGKADDLPSKYSVGLFAAAVNQRIKFPSALLSVALERMRAEAGRSEWIDSYRRDARTALIKALLIRNHQLKLSASMEDTNQQHPGYLIGQLFACIEQMQYLALGGQVNANVANRYFAAVSITPRLVLNGLMRDLESHYLKKATRKRPGVAKDVHRTICDLQVLYADLTPGEGYPLRLSPKEQGLFMIGYHVQCGHYLPPRQKPNEGSKEGTIALEDQKLSDATQ